MAGRLEGKTAIITGAAGGIGQASAILFANEGAKVACVDLKQDLLEATVEQISAEGGHALAIGADVSNREHVRAIIDQTIEAFGVPNIVFNNAGINPDNRRPLTEIPEDDFDRAFAVNVKAPWMMIKYVAPHMAKAGGGSIINTASISPFIVASTASYSASKAGVVALTKVAAVELGHLNIRVNALCPGATMTPLAEEQRKELKGRGLPTADDIIDRLSVLGRTAVPIEQARMALWLASDESSFATGSPFIVDGGWTCIGGSQVRA
ncbi:SDR family NAD(P)-dependent oxidoreductase [Novosphingobium album (ex Hu et al. 2023)]|uniref:SDR family oxidoreductase n=1 Tax=Novosphingobium album (ex Hu et al. 2023) TaxID=2930093 RepID=A0ABT0B5V2_9SPHN|nr:SDR family oxidoreductase [Novosphingobium album (ex Hu et al. 2023)]MCJ2180255.1 SDR family oxidoreductase [Novosphingobium album (ex Hu et al. 2023)]